MKINYFYIKALLLVSVLFFLFSFAKNRNESRKFAKIGFHFTNNENLYVTEKAVNKLLIQNNVGVQSVGKETLDLNRVESILKKHEMIENAEVFITIDGTLGATITQRQPIARVMDSQQFYIDRKGFKMPLSEYHSARVPIVTGVSENQLQEVFPLVDYIKNDEFLSRQVVGVERLPSGLYELQLREADFEVFFGRINNIELKFNNFKAFYQKAMKDKKLNTYSKVNLRFGNQVVCTKK